MAEEDGWNGRESARVAMMLLVVFAMASPSMAINQPHEPILAFESVLNDFRSAAIESSNHFLENRGQLSEGIRYYSRGKPAVAFMDGGVVSVLIRQPESSLANERVGYADTLSETSPEPLETRFHSYLIRPIGANHVIPIGRDRLAFNSNFIIGRMPQKWATGVPSFRAVVYLNIYEAIDLIFRSTLEGVEYDFLVHPGGDPDLITIAYEGAGPIELDNGELVVQLGLTSIRETAPYAFQEEDERRSCRFVLRDSATYGFDCAEWDRSMDLTIDPLIYSTFLGGSMTAEASSAVTVDSSGYAYVAGSAFAPDFPVTPGSFDIVLNGTADVFVTKLNSQGSSLVYSTFLGGSDQDWGMSIAVDESGAAYVAGYTTSADFPVTPNAYDDSYNGGDDVFVAKLSSIGDSLGYATYLGGNSTDRPRDMTLSLGGSVFITGGTASDAFPTSPTAFDRSLSAFSDGFVAKIDPMGSALTYSTLLGGDGSGTSHSIVVDSIGNAYVIGETGATNFPVTTGAYDTMHNGGNDVFVMKLDPMGSSLVYSTFVGGIGSEVGYSIDIDASGNVYVGGISNDPSSVDFPVTPGAFDTSYNGGWDAFVLELNASGDALLFSTYLGGSAREDAISIEVTPDGDVYASGWTYSGDFPTTGGAFQTSYGGIMDTFISLIDRSGRSLLYSTFLGGVNEDRPDYFSTSALALDGSIIVTGDTSSSDFPTTPGAFDRSLGGSADGYIARFNVLPDLDIGPSDVTFTPSGPVVVDSSVTIRAMVHNLGDIDARGAIVRFHDGLPSESNQIGQNQTLPSVPRMGGMAPVSVQWTAGTEGIHDICIVVDADNRIEELNETNNEVCVSIEVLFSRQLAPGHRLMSFPVAVADDGVESVLSSIAGCYDYVRWYDPLDSSDLWKSYMPGRTYNDLTRLDNTMGFWINITATCSFTPNGTRPVSTTIDLHRGWNMVGFPSFRTTYTVADFKADIGLAGVIVEAFDASAAPYYLQRVQDSYVMMAGEGYWVYVPSDGMWTIGG